MKEFQSIPGVDILLQVKMIELGIIPFSSACYSGRDNIGAALDSLPEHDRIKIKRRFRKLWRKALRKYRHQEIYYKNLKASCGVGLSPQQLKPYHYRARAYLVLKDISLKL